MRRLLATLLLLLTACARGAAPATLPLGKEDLPLKAGTYRSPDGFTPRLDLRLDGDGWQSVHRYDDFFDVGHPEPGADVPRLAIAFSRTDRAPDAVLRVFGEHPTDATLAGRAARFVEVTGHPDEEVYRNGDLGLYGAVGQTIRLYATAVGGTTLVVAVIVPDPRNWAAMRDEAHRVLDTLEVRSP